MYFGGSSLNMTVCLAFSTRSLTARSPSISSGFWVVLCIEYLHLLSDWYNSVMLASCRRLDYFVLSERLLKDVTDCAIRSEIYGSDHCPLVLGLALE